MSAKRIIICTLLSSFLFYVNVSANTAYTGMRGLTGLQITADMGAGINLFNTLDAYSGSSQGLESETYWGQPYTTQAMVTAFKNKGFKTIRIPVTWFNHTGGSPNYTINADWLARVETVVNYAFANDMYVILNTHHEGSWCKPTYAQQTASTNQLVAMWKQIANRFKNYGDYLIFETLNEPRLEGSAEEWTGGTAEGRDVVNKLNVAALNAIRGTGGNNSLRFIMCPSYAATGGGNPLNDYQIPNNDSKVLVSVHMYTPYSLCLQDPGVSNWGTDAEKSALSSELDVVKNKFINNGRGVVIGEWGAMYKNNTSVITNFNSYYVSTAKSKQLATVVWMYQFNRNTLTWTYSGMEDGITAPFKNCTATAITPYVQVNGGSWTQTGTATFASGTKVVLGPQPSTGGSWSWNGGCGTSGTSREQTIYPTSDCDIVATYKNDCGTTSTYTFQMRISGSQLIPNATYTMKASSNVYLTATTSGGLLNSRSTENGNYTKWKFVHLGSDVYEISSIQFAGQRLEIPNGTTGNGQQAAITTYTGAGEHLKWKASKVGSTFVFEPMHNLGFALDAYAAQATIVHLWTKDINNTNQLYTLINSSGVSLKSGVATISIDKALETGNRNIVVYPNPSNGNFTIRGQQGSLLEVLDLNGKLLLSRIVESNDSEISSGLASGMYLVKVSNNGNINVSKLIIR